MATVTHFQIAVTCDATGAATLYSPGVVTGALHAVKYTHGSLSNGATLTFTGEQTGLSVDTETLTTAATDFEHYPRAATHDQAGAASLYAAAGTAVRDRIVLGGERLKLVVAGGGNGGKATIDVWVDGTVQ